MLPVADGTGTRCGASASMAKRQRVVVIEEAADRGFAIEGQQMPG